MVLIIALIWIGKYLKVKLNLYRTRQSTESLSDERRRTNPVDLNVARLNEPPLHERTPLLNADEIEIEPLPSTSKSFNPASFANEIEHAIEVLENMSDYEIELASIKSNLEHFRKFYSADKLYDVNLSDSE